MMPGYMAKAIHHFRARIEIIGVNPFVFVPAGILAALQKAAGARRGKIPVRMEIDGHGFVQTLVKWKGAWRLYLNTPMRKAAGKEVGDWAKFGVGFDPKKRTVRMHAKLREALEATPEARAVYESLRPSLQLEIRRYLSFLKTEATVERNVEKAVQFLLGKGRFVGRDSPHGKR